DCAVGSAGLMRYAVAQATHHCAHRNAFGKALIDQPLMTNVLADLCIESEAATVLAMRMARACDDAVHDQAALPFRRIAVAVGKYWICKSAVAHVGEALECLGGNGFVEESGLPRLYRETPLNSIWEGSGNVNCLDVLRALAKTPESLEAYFNEVELASDPRLKDLMGEIRGALGDTTEIEARARRIVERMAIGLQASLLLRYGDAAVADAFCETRVAGGGGRAYGTLPSGIDFRRIVERHRPQL
ncbi:MAG TPA: acyl-CoA dehydrogenase family protein, partial [Vicinamibacterales bacterium]|nr:acyl-CoA dehydrogenase family protein [Vicinamibacterales bacterium]